jgi:predicted transposase/invertase (TIGR01784 family)
MIRRDTLWKGIIEDLAQDFFSFFFSDYAGEIDLNRDFEFLDKFIVRHLFNKGLEKTKIRYLLDFISQYRSFENTTFSTKFDEELQSITNSRKPMGIREAILKEVREQGIEQGVEREKQLVVIRAYEKGIPYEDIAQIADLTIEQVELIVQSYEAENE